MPIPVRPTSNRPTSLSESPYSPSSAQTSLVHTTTLCVALVSLDNRVLDFPRKQVWEMGFPHYGVSMIAYTKSETEGLKLWIAKRSASKVS